MKVLVIGSGGREHALAWKLARSARVTRVFVAPGNGGTQSEEGLINVPLNDVNELCIWAKENNIDLTVVGPEGALSKGVVDIFRANGLRIFGPTKAAAQLESSKAFSKDFMKRHAIPTADYATFSVAKEAHNYIDQKGAPIVVKADGLAAGKGVVVAMTRQEAHEAIDAIMSTNTLGIIHNLEGARVVIEEFLEGEEASFMVVTNGKGVCALATSQDHKRLLDADLGPNTGGMGAYSPAPVVTPQVHAKVMREIILPTLKGMEKDGIPYTGFLYAGLMIDKLGSVKTVEFNCRLGDPETQPLMMRLKSDLFELLMTATQEECEDGVNALDTVELQWCRRIAVGVVLASQGYPHQPHLGAPITGIPAERGDLKVFHAGTQLADKVLSVTGGRVLCVVTLADTMRAARQLVYEAIGEINFSGMQYRADIGYRALKKD